MKQPTNQILNPHQNDFNWLKKAAEPPLTRDVNRISGTDRANCVIIHCANCSDTIRKLSKAKNNYIFVDFYIEAQSHFL